MSVNRSVVATLDLWNDTVVRGDQPPAWAQMVGEGVFDNAIGDLVFADPWTSGIDVVSPSTERLVENVPEYWPDHVFSTEISMVGIAYSIDMNLLYLVQTEYNATYVPQQRIVAINASNLRQAPIASENLSYNNLNLVSRYHPSIITGPYTGVPITLSQDQTRLYVGFGGAGYSPRLAILNSSSLQVIRVWNVTWGSKSIEGLAADPLNGSLLMATGGQVTFFDGYSGSILGNLTDVAGGAGIGGLAFDAERGSIWTFNATGAVELNDTTGASEALIRLPNSEQAIEYGTTAFATLPGGDTLVGLESAWDNGLITIPGPGAMIFLDLSTGVQISEVNLSLGWYAYPPLAAWGSVYFGGSEFGGNGPDIMSVNASTMLFNQPITLEASIYGLAIDETNGCVFTLSTTSPALTRYNVSTHSLSPAATAVAMNLTGIAFDNVTDELLMADASAHEVLALNPSSNIVTQVAAVGFAPVGISFLAPSLVLTWNGSNLSVIDVSGDRAQENFTIPDGVSGLVYDPILGVDWILSGSEAQPFIESSFALGAAVPIPDDPQFAPSNFPWGDSYAAYDASASALVFEGDATLFAVSALNLSRVVWSEQISPLFQGGGVGYDPLLEEPVAANSTTYPDGTLSWVNLSGSPRTPSLETGYQPGLFGYDPMTQDLYVTADTAGSVSVVSGLELQSLKAVYSGSGKAVEVNISSRVQGGDPPYSYAYEGLPPGCTGQSGANVSCPLLPTGRFTVSESITDSLGAMVRGSVSIFRPLTAAVNQSTIGQSCTSAGVAAGTQLMSAYAYGGEPPYNFTWTAPNGKQFGPTVRVFVSSAQALPTLQLVVSDAAGDQWNGSVLAEAMFPPCLTISGPPPAGIWILSGLAIVGSGVGCFFILRRHKRLRSG